MLCGADEVLMHSGSAIHDMPLTCAFAAQSIRRVFLSGPGTGVTNVWSTASPESGVVCAPAVGTLQITDGAHVTNVSHTAGLGAVLNTKTLGNLVISNATVTGNQAAKSGAIYVGQQISGSVKVVNGSVVTGNAALSGSGGFLFAGDGTGVSR